MNKRILAFFLAFIMIFSAVLLASCAKENGGKDKDSKSTETDALDTLDDYIATYDPGATATEYVDEDVATKYDFEGHEFKFLNSAPIYYMYIYLDPEMTGDILDDCAYERRIQACRASFARPDVQSVSCVRARHICGA